MIWSLIKAFLLAIVGLPVTLIGLPLVAIGLPFRRSYPETMRPFSQYPEHGQWMLVDLPPWLKPWIKLEDNGMAKDAPIKDRIVGSVFNPGPWKTLA